MATPISTSLTQWDFRSLHVQKELQGGDFINAESILIAAGPPRIRFAGDASTLRDDPDIAEVAAFAYPIGVVENIGINQNKQLQRLFEIGSKRSYFIPGRNIGSINLARTLYNGPSVLRVLYAYYPPEKIDPSVAKLLSTGAGSRGDTFTPEIFTRPGFADFFINLDSDLFNQPFGLFILILDSDGAPYGAFYLEDAYLNNHALSINSSSVLVAEGVAIQYDQLIPVDMGVEARSSRNRKSIELSLSELLV